MKNYLKVLMIFIVIMLIAGIFTFSRSLDTNKTEKYLSEQLLHDQGLLRNFASNSKYKVYISTSLSPSAVCIDIIFPKDLGLKERVEFVKKILEVISLSDMQNNANTVPLNTTKISNKEGYAIISSTFLTYNNANLFQKVAVHPLVAFIYTGPNKNYRIRATSFELQTKGLFSFVQLPYGYKRCSFPLSCFAVPDVYDNIQSAPSCVIYHYTPVSFSSLKALSVKVTANMSVYPGCAGIIRRIDNGLTMESRVP